MKTHASLVLGAVVALAAAGQAFGWGASGHRIIGVDAIATLPDEVPAFLRTKAAADAVGEYSREPDRSKGSGKEHDADRDPGHFVDGGDDGKIAGVVSLTALPATREDYDSLLRGAGLDSWKIGYLPYSIIADWQQLAKDFAFWRVDKAGAQFTRDAGHKAWMQADQQRREQQILIDIGALSHFVGDGSMPLHATIHYNGWGAYPNPGGYTQEKVHSPWEGAYVRQMITADAVKAKVGPFHDCDCTIEQRVGAYIAADMAAVVPFYELEKTGAFKPGAAGGVEFTAARIAAGATELRDEIVLAWRASAAESVGFQPEVSVSDAEAGKVDPYDSLYGLD